MAAISSFMNYYENCYKFICVESDEEHLVENRISISYIFLRYKCKSIFKFKNSKNPPFLNLRFYVKTANSFRVRILLGTFC